MSKCSSRLHRFLNHATERRLLCGALALTWTVSTGKVAEAQAFSVTNLISDGSVPAVVTDSNFINPWAMSSTGNGWVSTAGTGFNYVVPGSTGAIAFKVSVPSAAQATNPGLPSGSVTTAGSTGMVLPNGTSASFLFSTLDGTISGWNSKLGTNGAVSQIVVNNSASGAVYTGLALLNTGGSSFLLAPNFASGAIDVYNSAFQPTKLAASFADPKLPAGYAPFGIHILGSSVFVTYAQKTASTATPVTYSNIPQPGAGFGIVDAFDFTGALQSRIVTGGNLNAPWGVAFAPASFGIYSDDLLIGNFGDGIINVFDPKTFTYIGQMMDATGKALVYPSLWELLPGGTAVTNSTTVSGGSTSSVYFTSGLSGEKHGLLAQISNGVPATNSAPTFGFSAAGSSLAVAAGSSATLNLSVAPVNGFTGSVSFACSGLPAGATCSFAPSALTVSATAAAQGAVTIDTSGMHARNATPARTTGLDSGTVFAFGLPVLSLALFGIRRGKARLALQMLSLSGLLLVGAAVIGCGSSNSAATSPSTPQGTSQVVVSATSGSVVQQATVTLTVQ